LTSKVEHDYLQAVNKYTEAITRCEELDGNEQDLAVFYLNRSICHIRLEEFKPALDDAIMAIEKEPNYVKAYYFRGLAHLGLKSYEDALIDFKFLFLQVFC
jgi:serine/threonine-protein phosphatase 5